MQVSVKQKEYFAKRKMLFAKKKQKCVQMRAVIFAVFAVHLDFFVVFAKKCEKFMKKV